VPEEWSTTITIDTILWRLVDAPGHDACRLEQRDDGWRLDGAAVFRRDNLTARLAYRLTCDAAWRTREGLVTGWMGERLCDLRIGRTPGGVWTLNGEPAPNVEGCLDLDFGFTPATNLSQLRRIALEIGEAADVPVAWLDVTAGTIAVLDQRYERRTAEAYWYEAPRFDYAALLEVHSSGLISHYPGLWEEER
jgi:hypothetical protein